MCVCVCVYLCVYVCVIIHQQGCTYNPKTKLMS